MKLRFILNPRSGRNRRRPWLAPHIRKFIAEHKLDATLVTTARAGHATSLARVAVREGCDRVIAVGGDGTMNEVAQALLHTSTALGLVPCGSGNGLALHLSIPTRLDQALALAVASSAVISAIDTGSANGHAFFNAMGSGFDAEISERFNHLERRGLAAYARTGFAAFRERRSRRVTIRTATRRHELDSLLIAVANSDQYGNHAVVAPGARVDDGELDLIAIAPIGFKSALPLIARLFTGRLLGSPHVTRIRGVRFVIEREEPGLIHTDGETHRTGANIEVLVHPRSLHVVLPPTTTLAPSNLLQCHRPPAARPMSILPHRFPAPAHASVAHLCPRSIRADAFPDSDLLSPHAIFPHAIFPLTDTPNPSSNLLGYSTPGVNAAAGNLLGYSAAEAGRFLGRLSGSGMLGWAGGTGVGINGSL